MAGKAAVFAGFISIAVLFLVYSRYQNPEMIIPEAFDDVQRLIRILCCICSLVCKHCIRVALVPPAEITEISFVTR